VAHRRASVFVCECACRKGNALNFEPRQRAKLQDNEQKAVMEVK